MEIVQMYLAEAKRLYISSCIEDGYNPDKEVIKRFDELIEEEGILIKQTPVEEF